MPAAMPGVGLGGARGVLVAVAREPRPSHHARLGRPRAVQELATEHAEGHGRIGQQPHLLADATSRPDRCRRCGSAGCRDSGSTRRAAGRWFRPGAGSDARPTGFRWTARYGAPCPPEPAHRAHRASPRWPRPARASATAHARIPVGRSSSSDDWANAAGRYRCSRSAAAQRLASTAARMFARSRRLSPPRTWLTPSTAPGPATFVASTTLLRLPLLQPGADDAFGGTIRLRAGRHRVHLGRVDEVDALVERVVDLLVALLLGVLFTEGHGAKPDRTHLDSSAAQWAVFHRQSFFGRRISCTSPSRTSRTLSGTLI